MSVIIDKEVDFKKGKGKTMRKKMKEIDTNFNVEKEENKAQMKEISKIMKEVLNTTKEYKNRNIDDLKTTVINQIKMKT